MTFPDTYQTQAEPVPDAPAFNLATAKARLAITEATQDAAIQYALDTALAMAERYCDRVFSFKAETVRFVNNQWPVLLVRRWPIDSVTSVAVVVEGQPARVIDAKYIEVDREKGKVNLSGSWGGGYAGTYAGLYGWRGTVELTYEGGYKILPADLQQALWLIFDQVWTANPGMGGDSGAIGGTGVRQFAMDGMSLTFDTASSDKASSQASGDVGPWGLIPLQAATLLQFYRAETVVGAA